MLIFYVSFFKIKKYLNIYRRQYSIEVVTKDSMNKCTNFYKAIQRFVDSMLILAIVVHVTSCFYYSLYYNCN